MPIPGTKSRARLEENAAAASVSLTAADLAALDAALPLGAAQGGRYPEAMKPQLGLMPLSVLTLNLWNDAGPWPRARGSASANGSTGSRPT